MLLYCLILSETVIKVDIPSADMHIALLIPFYLINDEYFEIGKVDRLKSLIG
jgi:hypothetical protein